MPETLLGLDIGSRNIKVALLKRGKKPQLLDTDVIKTPEGSVSDGAIIFMDAVAGCLKAYIDGLGAKPAGFAVCINSPDIITRSLSLPSLSAQEIPAAVKFEILKFFPSIKDTHEITQTVLSTGESSVSALAALCPRELIGSYQELAARLGIPLRRITVRADAQVRAASYYGGADGCGVFVDIGYRNSVVSVANRGGIALSRYTMSGTAAYDNMISEKAGATRDDIEKARLRGDFSGLAIDASANEYALSMCFMDIADQIRQSIDQYGGDAANEKPAYLAVTGEGGLIPGIAQYLAGSFNLEARDFVPGNAGKTDCGALMKGGNPKLLYAAAGAALGGDAGAGREMNFTPSSDAGVSGGGFRLSRLTAAVAAAALIAVVSAASGFYSMYDHRRSDAEIARINAEITQDIQAAEHRKAIDGARVKLSALSAVLDSMDSNSAKASAILDDLASQAPESLFITNFNMPDANDVIMSGRSRDYGSVSEFALLLRETGKYNSVKINTITANQTASELISDYGFSITVTINAVNN